MTTYLCRTLIDGTGAPASGPVHLTVDGTTIAGVGPGAPDGPVVDLGGLTVLPGLIDAHVHLGWLNLTGEDPPAVLAAQIFENARLAIEGGFTTVRDVGGIDGGVVAAVERGLVPGPRILPSGPIVVQTGGHGDVSALHLPHDASPDIPGLARFSHVVDGPDQVRHAVRRAFRLGATQIKMCISGGVVSHSDRLTDTQFSLDEMRVAVEEAAARGSYVTAHAHTPEAMRRGLQAGITCFEHATFLDEETAKMAADHGAAVVPTMSVVRLAPVLHREWGIAESMLSGFVGVEERMSRSIELALEHGLLVGSGSDLLGPHQDRRGLEIGLKAAVMGPLAAIASATSVNAAILRRGDLGVLAAGGRADFIAVDGDPVADPAVLDDPTRIVLVVKDGVVVKDTRVAGHALS